MSFSLSFRKKTGSSGPQRSKPGGKSHYVTLGYPQLLESSLVHLEGVARGKPRPDGLEIERLHVPDFQDLSLSADECYG